MSGTVCSYKGCAKSYSTDKDVSFFKFPDDQKRRKKWMENCANPDLLTINERQLRHKRVCSDHFAPSSFTCSVSKTQLTDKAVPMTLKENEAAIKAQEGAQREPPPGFKRGRGRPPKFSLVLVKKESEEKKEKEAVEEEEEESDEEKEEEKERPNENGDLEYTPPPTLRKQTKESNGSVVSPEPKGKVFAKPPRLVAVNSDDTPTPKGKPKPSTSSSTPSVVKTKPSGEVQNRTESEKEKEKRSSTAGAGRRMADLSVIDDVVREMTARSKKRVNDTSDDKSAKKAKSSDDGVGEGEDKDSEDLDDSDIEESDEEDEGSEEGLEKANREFEMFQAGLRKVIKIPRNWGMGAVVWDPLNKIKVIPIVEPKLYPNGTIILFKSIQIFEDSTVKVTVDGVDMTLNFGIQTIQAEEDVNKIIKAVAWARVCAGVENFLPDDIIYLPEARKRGFKYFSDACPVILEETVIGDVCNPCISLQNALLARKEKEKEDLASRKLRPIPKDLKNNFGRSLYGLLGEILDDSDALKSDDKEAREAVLAKYSTELGVMNGEIQKPEKIPHVQISVEEVAASFRDIVTRLGFNLNKKPGPGGAPIPPTPPPNQIPRPKPKVEENRSPFANKPFLSKFARPQQPQHSMPIRRSAPMVSRPTTMIPVASSSSSVSIPSGSNSFSLADGQTFEILGEVGGNGGEDTKGPIEIIEVDEETMAKLTAQNPGMVFQNAASSSSGIQVTTLDPSDPNMSHILKAINSTQT